jgi:hypothetical protein
VSFNAAIREAAGRSRPELFGPDQPEPVADLGIGRGEAASPPQKRDSSSAAISAEIRRAAAAIRGRASLDDLYPDR